ncbi:MAG: glucose-6-phosphate dehydrogenase [bacterium]
MSSLVITIFGASGDLTFRKLIPAIFQLYKKNLLPESFTIIGFARKEWNKAGFVEFLNNNIDKSEFNESDTLLWEEFSKHLSYISSDFNNAIGYTALADIIKHIESQNEKTTKLFYLSTSPEYFKTIAEQINLSELSLICRNDTLARIIVEKPYGTSLQNVIDTDMELRKTFSEEHIYRIDHYLGKESVQNILVFRFANSLFDKLWNNEHIEWIQIKVNEKLGVENRGPYFDNAGAIKDMVQNHILQVLSIVTMEVPNSQDPADIQKNRLNIIKNIDFFSNKEEDFIKGQYEGYLKELGVNENSITETYAFLKLKLNIDKWNGVPIYVRTGKKLSTKLSEINIKFKDGDNNYFDKIVGNVNNILSFRIQPDEGISLMILTKKPGEKDILTPVSLDFCYKPLFNNIADSYVGLLKNIIDGDQSLFASIDEIIAQWGIMEKIEKRNNSTIYTYNQNSDGPEIVKTTMGKNNVEWVDNKSYTCSIK